MSQSPEYVAKNASDAATFKPEDILPLVAEKVDFIGMILTCMDPRLDPHAPEFGAKLGDTALIRNGDQGNSTNYCYRLANGYQRAGLSRYSGYLCLSSRII
ncbi:hypothetical protein C8J56DRAFT_1043755 [Mycena floridula]|nr:hypothetical protein C8J56DRAFT_1043755 [Mycena floridula]